MVGLVVVVLDTVAVGVVIEIVLIVVGLSVFIAGVVVVGVTIVEGSGVVVVVVLAEVVVLGLTVTQRRMSGPSSMLSGQAHVYLGEWSVI